MSFLIPKIWQILKLFAGTFHVKLNFCHVIKEISLKMGFIGEVDRIKNFEVPNLAHSLMHQQLML